MYATHKVRGANDKTSSSRSFRQGVQEIQAQKSFGSIHGTIKFNISNLENLSIQLLIERNELLIPHINSNTLLTRWDIDRIALGYSGGTMLVIFALGLTDLTPILLVVPAHLIITRSHFVIPTYASYY